MSESADNPETTNPPPIYFPALDPENIPETLTELESYCVNCSQNGTTKLLLTSIPFFKQIIISSFSCPHCSYHNNELQSAQEIEKYGIELILHVKPPATGSTPGQNGNDDLNRQVIFSANATITIPELELEMLAKHHKGDVTTVEGIFQRTIDALSQDQPRRQLENPNDYESVAKFIFRVEEYQTGKKEFTLHIRDISGNSFISPPAAAKPGQEDPHLKISQIIRTTDENHELGIFSATDLQENVTNLTLREEDEEQENTATVTSTSSGSTTVETPVASRQPSQINQNNQEQLLYEVHSFSLPCPNCGEICDTKMRPTKIPHFKEVIVMATHCEACGYRTNEIKSGSGIEPKGKRWILEVKGLEDMSRDVLKSETCLLEIPSLEFHVGAGTLVSKFTTLEGILKDSRENMMLHNPFILACDGTEESVKEKFKLFNQKFDELLVCKEPYVVIFDDPAGNSYVQNLCDPEGDPQLKCEEYERSFEENEALGLNDMKTENYGKNDHGKNVNNAC